MDLWSGLQPKWLKASTLSADWWHIDMRDLVVNDPWRRSSSSYSNCAAEACHHEIAHIDVPQSALFV